ncbi:hypothetical protein V6N12_009347 [Hibiscus sabdariffa]|uniref:Uncharacterized protein n=1 Tax=Hibiscus sabdariffa TaxID=183260 RepID=A0ABR2ECG5_9ROSI
MVVSISSKWAIIGLRQTRNRVMMYAQVDNMREIGKVGPIFGTLRLFPRFKTSYGRHVIMLSLQMKILLASTTREPQAIFDVDIQALFPDNDPFLYDSLIAWTVWGIWKAYRAPVLRRLRLAGHHYLQILLRSIVMILSIVPGNLQALQLSPETAMGILSMESTHKSTLLVLLWLNVSL